jgi:hypothetical protein
VILSAVARHLAPAGEEHEVGRAVPLFDHVQAFVYFAAQRLNCLPTSSKPEPAPLVGVVSYGWVPARSIGGW